MSYDPFLALTMLLLLMTAVIAVLYYRRIGRAREAYEEAREVVGDVIISFDKQLERQEASIRAVTRETEALSLEREETVRRIEESDKRLENLAAKVEDFSGVVEKVSARFNNLDERVEERITQKIAEVERIEREVSVMPEAGIEAVIPIKRERVLSPLTETELTVLEILSEEGERTATEIRGRIHLSREHTSRLMRKLYENGYVERDTGKTPYTYRIKKEMLKILKKTRTKAEA